MRPAELDSADLTAADNMCSSYREVQLDNQLFVNDRLHFFPRHPTHN